jgi:dienelactone hydrolase
MSLQAAVESQTITYRDGEVELEGFAAWPVGKKATSGVLIVHQWMGLTDYEKGRAKQLAEMGHYVFALDVYGVGNRPANRSEAGKAAGAYKGDRQLFRKRLGLGLNQLLKLSGLKAGRTTAIGYCFGGTGVLELARSGAGVAGVVSFHGGLGSPTPADAKQIKAKVLVCHGADDPFVPDAEVAAFKKEMRDGGVDWQLIYYSDAVHAFTQKMAGSDKSKGAAYDARADARSWAHMQQFFAEALAE